MQQNEGVDITRLQRKNLAEAFFRSRHVPQIGMELCLSQQDFRIVRQSLFQTGHDL